MPPPSPNRRLVEVVARRLGPMRHEVALVGGTSVEFLLTDPAAPEVRPTQDVDLIVEARTYAEYVSRFGDRLRERGFLECSDRDAPMCRWVVDDVRVDFMPTGEEALGFTNRWYASALAASGSRAIGKGLELRVVTAPYFLATKAEAFKGRGEEDYLVSADLEDFVTIIDGRPEVVSEVLQSAEDLASYLAAFVSDLLEAPDFLNALPGYLGADTASRQRVGLVLERLRRIAASIQP